MLYDPIMIMIAHIIAKSYESFLVFCVGSLHDFWRVA